MTSIMNTNVDFLCYHADFSFVAAYLSYRMCQSLFFCSVQTEQYILLRYMSNETKMPINIQWTTNYVLSKTQCFLFLEGISKAQCCPSSTWIWAFAPWKFNDSVPFQITVYLEQKCYKEMRAERYGSVKVVMAIYRKVICSCQEQL